jgi:hypothetical protein
MERICKITLKVHKKFSQVFADYSADFRRLQSGFKREKSKNLQHESAEK